MAQTFIQPADRATDGHARQLPSRHKVRSLAVQLRPYPGVRHLSAGQFFRQGCVLRFRHLGRLAPRLARHDYNMLTTTQWCAREEFAGDLAWRVFAIRASKASCF